MKNRKTQRGYTAVEVMMSMTLLLVGAVGVMAMQRAAVQGNTDAREMDVASSIARKWMERAERDSTLWTPSTVAATPPANVQYASIIDEGVNTNTAGTWFVPSKRLVAGTVANQGDTESAGFDILGQDLVSLTNAGLRYCVNLRVTPLTTDQTLMRVEARVFWPRNLTVAPDATYCSAAPPASLDTDVTKYHFVYAATAVRQNAQP
jgi:prepilin-type N-terminal cleavage/methylation domain-containing protein